MNTALSPNSQVTLLLTAPLLPGGKSLALKLLTATEFNQVGRALKSAEHQLADLIGPCADEIITDCLATFDKSRLTDLLSRGFLLSQCAERWSTRSIWVTCRADADYPKRLKERLRGAAPPLIYGIGDIAILSGGGFGVLGSRKAEASILEYSELVGRFSAEAGLSLISGGARGVDSAAMLGAMAAKGTVIGVLADGLEKAALARENRNAIMENRLVLISPYDPLAGFNVGHAMQRNKLVYALADACLVMSADFKKGGTWTGAIEQFEKFRLIPIFAYMELGSKGNRALVEQGAIPWPNPKSTSDFHSTVLNITLDTTKFTTQPALSFDERNEQTNTDSIQTGNSEPELGERLLNYVKELLCDELKIPKTGSEIATNLRVSLGQTLEWLDILSDRGLLVHDERSGTYQTCQ